MAQVLDGLDDIRKAKVKEFADKAHVKYRPGAARATPAATSAPSGAQAQPGINMAKLPPRLAAAMKAVSGCGLTGDAIRHLTDAWPAPRNLLHPHRMQISRRKTPLQPLQLIPRLPNPQRQTTRNLIPLLLLQNRLLENLLPFAFAQPRLQSFHSSIAEFPVGIA